MYSLSYTRYVIALAYLCNSIVPDNIGAFTTSPDKWRLDISVSSRTMSDGSTSRPTFAERNVHTRGEIVTNSVSVPVTTDNDPSLDQDCPDDNDICVTTSSSQSFAHEVVFAVVVINRVQLAITCAGFFANAATYLTLTFNGGWFSPLILLLLKHQSLLDMGACGMGSLYLFLPTGRWLTGSLIVDFVVCHSWHTQMIFWICVTISIWNLVLIGVERFIMIRKPFLYGSVTRKHFFYSFAVVYVGCLICVFPSSLRLNLVDGECSMHGHSERFWYRFFYVHSFVIIIAFYVLPVMAFVFLYG